MTNLLEIKLPDELMETLPSDRTQMIGVLSNHFDEVIRQYEQEFTNSVGGCLGQALSRYEKSMLKDFLIRMTLGKKLSTSVDSAIPISNSLL